MKDIAIYGAGGYGCEIACLISAINEVCKEWNLIGFFDDGKAIRTKNNYGEVLGGINELNAYDKELAVVMAIGTPGILNDLVSKIVNPMIYFPNIFAPDIVFHDKDSVKFGKGNVILFHSIISCNTNFGNFNLLNNGVMIGHDSKIGDFNVFNPTTRISGEVQIGNTNFFGVGAIVLQGLTVGDFIKIAANSCIMRSAKNKGLYMGSPAVLRPTPDMLK